MQAPPITGSDDAPDDDVQLDTARPDTAAELHFAAVFVHFFVNLRLAGDVHAELERLGLSRIHNRILAVAAADPGVTVGELVAVLSVTHQNIRLPMKELIHRDLLVAQVDHQDRRTRRLRVTPAGHDLVQRVLANQSARIGRAFATAGPEDVAAFFRVHELMLDDPDRQFVERLRARVHPADLDLRET